jgi:hypothetical protein
MFEARYWMLDALPPANSERAGASMTQEPPLALFAWSASPVCAATNSNNAKDGTYPSKREGQRGVGGNVFNRHAE